MIFKVGFVFVVFGSGHLRLMLCSDAVQPRRVAARRGGGWGPGGARDQDPGAASGQLEPRAQTGVGRAAVKPAVQYSAVQQDNNRTTLNNVPLLSCTGPALEVYNAIHCTLHCQAEQMMAVLQLPALLHLVPGDHGEMAEALVLQVIR